MGCEIQTQQRGSDHRKNRRGGSLGARVRKAHPARAKDPEKLILAASAKNERKDPEKLMLVASAKNHCEGALAATRADDVRV